MYLLVSAFHQAATCIPSSRRSVPALPTLLALAPLTALFFFPLPPLLPWLELSPSVSSVSVLCELYSRKSFMEVTVYLRPMYVRMPRGMRKNRFLGWMVFSKDLKKLVERELDYYMHIE